MHNTPLGKGREQDPCDRDIAHLKSLPWKVVPGVVATRSTFARGRQRRWLSRASDDAGTRKQKAKVRVVLLFEVDAGHAKVLYCHRRRRG